MATSNKTFPAIIIGAIVLVAVAYFTGVIPTDSEVTGTVAPAERYRAEQPSSDGIRLGDQSIQQLMQTDAFDRLINHLIAEHSETETHLPDPRRHGGSDDHRP